jgi:FAD/FMN-containing dehydrogenase
MTDLSTAIANDLRRLVKGEVRFDDRSRAMYSTAACMFQIEPLGVVSPRDVRDVQQVVRYCRRHMIPITGRGAGSSVAGQAVGPGIILDFATHMNRLLELDPARRIARVQPGIVLEALNRKLARHRLVFPPDPSSAGFCTLGGMINTNAGGVHSVKYGTTREWIRSLEVVLDTGDRASFERTGRPKRRTRLGEIVAGTTALLRGFAETIEAGRPDVPKNSSGYHVYDALRGGSLDLHRLYSGSEGTLAVLTEASLRLAPAPRSRVLAVLGYRGSIEACGRIEAILKLGPSALELVDETTMEVLLGFAPQAGESIGGPGAYLLVEFDNAPRRLKELKRVARARSFAEPDTNGAAEVWRLRRAVSPALERRPGPRRSTRVNEDVGVHPSRVGEYIELVKGLLRRYGFEAALFGHAGSGNIHVNLFVDTTDPNDLERIQVFGLEAYRAVREMRGTMSAEHGDGMLRAPYMREFYGDLFGLFEALKAVFDPAGILNPGKKLAPRGYRFSQDFRIERRPAHGGPHDSRIASIERHLHACNGCAKCHTYCPLYLEEPVEFSSPRAKVNLLMAAGQNRIPLEELLADGVFRSHLEACLSCRRCLSDCPAGTDLPAIGGHFAAAVDRDREG